MTQCTAVAASLICLLISKEPIGTVYISINDEIN